MMMSRQRRRRRRRRASRRAIGGLSESLAISLGRFLEASWGFVSVSSRSRGPLEASWVPLRCLFWLIWGRLGASWGPLGGLLGHLRRFVAPSWGRYGGPWRPSWGHFGGYRSKKGEPPLETPKSPLGALFGPLLEGSSAFWGPSQGYLGTSPGALSDHLGASLRPRKAIGGRLGDNANIADLLMSFDIYWRLGGRLGRLCGRLGPS